MLKGIGVWLVSQGYCALVKGVDTYWKLIHLQLSKKHGSMVDIDSISYGSSVHQQIYDAMLAPIYPFVPMLTQLLFGYRLSCSTQCVKSYTFAIAEDNRSALLFGHKTSTCAHFPYPGLWLIATNHVRAVWCNHVMPEFVDFIVIIVCFVCDACWGIVTHSHAYCLNRRVENNCSLKTLCFEMTDGEFSTKSNALISLRNFNAGIRFSNWNP